MIPKNGFVGIGTLLIFIALLILAAGAAGVIMYTNDRLGENARVTGEEARAHTSVGGTVIEVSGYDGSNGTITDLRMILKLSSGSDPVKIDGSTFTMNTWDSTTVLGFRGMNGTHTNGNTGYQTFKREQLDRINLTPVLLDNDLDDDGLDDYVYVHEDGAVLVFNISNNSSSIYANVSLGQNISGAGETPVTLDVNQSGIQVGESTYGTILVLGTTSTNSTIDASVNTTLVPANIGSGYFTAKYLERGPDWVAGTMHYGDVIMIYFEAPRPLVTQELLRLNILPSIGNFVKIDVTTPDVMTTRDVYLYP